MTLEATSTCPQLNPPPDCQCVEAISDRGGWLQSFIRNVDARTCFSPTNTHPSVTRLRTLIESTPRLRMWASAMFQEIPNKVPYNRIDQAQPPQSPVRGYEHMLELLSAVIPEVAPTWSLSAAGLGLMGLPFQAILDWPMGTPSGHAFFLDADVNTNASRSVITTAPGHWLCPEAVAAVERDGNLDSSQRYTFEQLFECDPHGDPMHWGFCSWDDYFTRKFRDMDRLRPVGYPDRPDWVVNSCESKPIVVRSDVKAVDQFWLKEANYSIFEMLNHHEWAEQFVGGTIHQSVLRTTAYHRWCAPVSGQVVYAAMMDGAYFSERSTNGIGSAPVGPPLHNLVYLSHVATRAVVFIQADDAVGLVCFLAIGIADVSSCEILPRFTQALPQRIEKGEELGMFHYGGSSQCLLFRRGVKLAFTEGALPGNQKSLAIRSPLALAYV
ncbi:phosphatidylserine decarboxylase family [Cordyceps militaris]|uniref:Phosphatidylserine decarboxylase family n=1 Tax=Cordyceps militaris TaxID=73501 RepID=A0A2H4S5H2_CORMI|nr:phosphatidylserine decarboxylase family [Cordyceps militaris]